MPIEIAAQAHHIFGTTLSLAAHERHVDRFEIEPIGPHLVQIFDGTVIGTDDQIIPGINQARGVEDRADVGFAVFWLKTRQAY